MRGSPGYENAMTIIFAQIKVLKTKLRHWNKNSHAQKRILKRNRPKKKQRNKNNYSQGVQFVVALKKEGINPDKVSVRM